MALTLARSLDPTGRSDRPDRAVLRWCRATDEHFAIAEFRNDLRQAMLVVQECC